MNWQRWSVPRESSVLARRGGMSPVIGVLGQRATGCSGGTGKWRSCTVCRGEV